ncbi:MAG: hypothetical protein WC462_01495 [archaeon]
MVNLSEFPNVKLIKFPELDEVDLALVSKALTHFFKKVGSDSELQLSLKEYKKGGLRAQHEVHARLTINGKSFFAEYVDWQLLETIQNVLKKIEKEISKEINKKE